MTTGLRLVSDPEEAAKAARAALCEKASQQQGCKYKDAGAERIALAIADHGQDQKHNADAHGITKLCTISSNKNKTNIDGTIAIMVQAV